MNKGLPIYDSISEMSDAHLISAIRQNYKVQEAHHPDSSIATEARLANRPYFAEAQRRKLPTYLAEFGESVFALGAL